ncbi:MAG: alanine racemase [Victivallales bacterium]|nr:alanine racemase [Victivallales bacterium]
MYPTEVNVNYDILKENFRAFKSRFPQMDFAAVVKSDAYGHGLIETAKAFISGGAEILTVFRVTEAIRLRDAGISCRIWCLLGPLPDETEAACRLENVTMGIFSFEQAAALSAACVAQHRTVHIHLAVETGMGRLGFLPEDVPAALKTISGLPGLELKGIYSHIAKAEEPDALETQHQVAAFRQTLALLPSECTENHICASYAFMNDLVPELHYARLGICLYKEVTLPGDAIPLTKDAMTLKTRLISVKRLPAGHPVSYGCTRILQRDSIVGIAPLGYDDGVLRGLSNRASALVGGQRVPYLGRICMSMIMLDLTDVPNAAPNDEVVLLGHQGNETITLDELTNAAQTTWHELICNIGRAGRQ